MIPRVWTNLSKGWLCMASNDYYERIDETFEAVENRAGGTTR